MSNSLYPQEQFGVSPWFPNDDEFEIRPVEGKGRALVCLRDYNERTLLARFAGYVTHEVLQHTLQITPALHLHDPFFIGYLAHSSNPNVFLDMVSFEIWSTRKIQAGDVLAMDYTATEDRLFRQFIDYGDPEHRLGRIVHGRKEVADPVLVAELAQAKRKAMEAWDYP